MLKLLLSIYLPLQHSKIILPLVIKKLPSGNTDKKRPQYPFNTITEGLATDLDQTDLMGWI